MTRIVTTMDTIRHRQAKLFDTVRQTMLDKRWLAVRDSSSARSSGGIVNLRPLMLAKVGIFDDGVNLFTNWPAIERERRIPWDVHAANMVVSAWGVAGMQMHSKFYSTKTKDFTELELLSPGWHPVEETAIPGFATVSTEDALAVLGLIGGQHPEVDHPTTEFTVSPSDIALRANEVRDIDLVADGRAEFPVQYEITTAEAPWIMVSEFGTLTLSPGAVAGIFLQEITATDALGVTVTFSIKIALA